ncbi:MAG TPA: hypothetical protein VK864_07830 [Longimicrobiales bacterium]|nr:hypothetical protein [Longimicrobiales bacterium]
MMKEQSDKFDELMRDAAHTYNRPPDHPPLDQMWSSIERALQERRPRVVDQFATSRGPGRGFEVQPWLRLAAVLVLGIALGRLSIARSVSPSDEAATASNPGSVAAVPQPYQVVTGRYLGETAALLIALPAELESRRADSAFISRADDLLLQTRRLLESPAAADPSLRTLFEDLEVVLVQVVRLQTDRDPTKIELLNQALEQSDVIPRLRNAVVDHIAD